MLRFIYRYAERHYAEYHNAKEKAMARFNQFDEKNYNFSKQINLVKECHMRMFLDFLTCRLVFNVSRLFNVPLSIWKISWVVYLQLH